MKLPSAPRVAAKPSPGTVVRFSAYFLRETSQRIAGRWVVRECDCRLCAGGRHVAVNEPTPRWSDDPTPHVERPKWRHIAFENLIEDTIDDGPKTPRVSHA